MSLNPYFGGLGPFSRFPRVMDEMRREMEMMERQFAPYWKEPNSQLSTGHDIGQVLIFVYFEVVNDENKYAVSVDVSHFHPEELSVKVDGRVVTISGDQEVDKDGHYSKRSFVRKWTLPQDVDPENVKSSLSDKGHLSIQVVKNPALTNSARNIPIMPASK